MKLASYSRNMVCGIGIVYGDVIVDITGAYSMLFDNPDYGLDVAKATLPSDIIKLVEAGDDVLRILEDFESTLLEEVASKCKEPVVLPIEDVELLAPIVRPPKIICIGLNYRKHAEETGKPIPKEPIIFSKYATAVTGHQSKVYLPKVSTQVDYEAELAVIIGKKGKDILEEDAMDHVFGYTCFNDISARDLQFRDGQWMKGKTCDGFAPMGPWIVLKDEISDPQNLDISLKLNGQVMQDGNTADMIFNIPTLISFLSSLFTLEPGDIIATGTPPGVGVARDPQVFLKPGDVTEVEVQGIGVLRNTVK